MNTLTFGGITYTEIYHSASGNRVDAIATLESGAYLGRFAIMAKPSRLEVQSRRHLGCRYTPPKEAHGALKAWAQEMGVTPLPDYWFSLCSKMWELERIDWSLRKSPVEWLKETLDGEDRICTVIVSGMPETELQAIRVVMPARIELIAVAKQSMLDKQVRMATAGN